MIDRLVDKCVAELADLTDWWAGDKLWRGIVLAWLAYTVYFTAAHVVPTVWGWL
jgi:hypothetical protein